MNLAQTISIKRNLDLNAILLWRLSDVEKYITSKAWQDDVEQEQMRYQFFSELAKSINQTQSAAANAIVKTIASRRN